MSKVCPNCGTKFDDDQNFCSSCGTKLDDESFASQSNVSVKVCPNCGATFEEDQKFCSSCGTKLDDESFASQSKAFVKICPNCGTKLEADQKFCSSCGAGLDTNSFASQSNVYVEDKTPQEIFLRKDGRLNRLRYFKRILLLGVVEIVAVVVCALSFIDPWGNISSFGDFLTFMISLLATYPTYCLTIRRLHDLGKDDIIAVVYCLLTLVALKFFYRNPNSLEFPTWLIIDYVLQTGITLYLFLMPGVRGKNKYGADPLG